MDLINLSNSPSVINGLSQMLTAAIGPHEYQLTYVDIPLALFIVEIAKRAEDRPEWFPRGRWATIQSIESNIEDELSNLFHESTE